MISGGAGTGPRPPFPTILSTGWPVMLRLLCAALLALLLPLCASAQTLQDILQSLLDEVASPSRSSVGVVLNDIVASGLPEAAAFLRRWQANEVRVRLSDGLFFLCARGRGHADPDRHFHGRGRGNRRRSGPAGRGQAQWRCPPGHRRSAGAAPADVARYRTGHRARRDLARARRRAAGLLLASIEPETDPGLRARKERLAGYLIARFGEDEADRIAAIEALSGDLSTEGRAVLNQILTTTRQVADALPEGAIIARTLTPGSDALPRAETYALLVEGGAAAYHSRRYPRRAGGQYRRRHGRRRADRATDHRRGPARGGLFRHLPPSSRASPRRCIIPGPGSSTRRRSPRSRRSTLPSGSPSAGAGACTVR